jgi:phosphotriesterase-related protein
MISRRTFLASAGAAASAQAPVRVPSSVLVHEHVLVDFAGAAAVSRSRYDLDEAFRAARPKLEELKPHGCVRFLECTPNYIGRDPRLLRRLQDETGIEIWTNTGLYGARDHFFLPDYAKTESAEQLARRWIEEARKGAEGMKPRFVKIGVNNAPLNEVDRKLVEAAALTAKETGLTVASHTGGRGPAALEQIGIFERLKCPLSKFVWVHAQSEKDHSYHEKAARADAWVEFDGINAKSAAWHRECVEHMAGRQLLGRTLISQDSGWFRVGEPGGGQFNGFTWLYTGFLPLLEGKLWRPLLVDNPRAAFGR